LTKANDYAIINTEKAKEYIQMEKIFNNAREMAEYFVNENTDRRTYPTFLQDLYREDNALTEFFYDMYDKYVRGKPLHLQLCEEFQTAKENAIKFVEEEIIKHGYDLAILYTCETLEANGYYAYFKVKIENIPQQLKIF
jgi:hypothetical protein